MRGLKVVFGIFIVVFVQVFMSPILWAKSPKELVKETTDKVLAILRDPSLKGAEKKQELKHKLWKEISRAIDLEEISKRALGLYWRERSDKEKKEFIDLFSSIVQNFYIDRIVAYSDEEIVYLGEEQDNHYSTVQTKIIAKTGTEITVDYRLFDERGEWRVYDISVEGVSLVNNYRTQFNNILVKSSYEKLVEKMKQKRISANRGGSNK